MGTINNTDYEGLSKEVQETETKEQTQNEKEE